MSRRRPWAVVVAFADDREVDARELAAKLDGSGYEVAVQRRTAAYAAGHMIGTAVVAAVVAVVLLGLIALVAQGIAQA